MYHFENVSNPSVLGSLISNLYIFRRKFPQQKSTSYKFKLDADVQKRNLTKKSDYFQPNLASTVELDE